MILNSKSVYFRDAYLFARMASAADVRDIMGLPAQETAITKDSIINADKKKKEKKKDSGVFQRPEGMHRELYNLLYSENKELPCPLIQTDTNKHQGYKQMRAKLGMRKVGFCSCSLRTL